MHIEEEVSKEIIPEVNGPARYKVNIPTDKRGRFMIAIEPRNSKICKSNFIVKGKNHSAIHQLH